jgi:hypothetical protein
VDAISTPFIQILFCSGAIIILACVENFPVVPVIFVNNAFGQKLWGL